MPIIVFRTSKVEPYNRIKVPQEEMALLDADAEWVTPDMVKAHLPPSSPLLADDIDKNALIDAQEAEFSNEKELAKEEGSRYCLLEGILYSIAKPNINIPQYPCVVLPEQWREQVIKRCHREVGHQSHWKTINHIQECYVWPGMKRDVINLLEKCGLCQVHIKRPEKVEMGEMPIATCGGQYIGLDLIGPLVPSTLSNSVYVMTCIDHYSGWAEGYPLTNKTNEKVWERLRNDYLPRHGAPEVILTDQGSEWKGTDFAQWLRGIGIAHHKASP